MTISEIINKALELDAKAPAKSGEHYALNGSEVLLCNHKLGFIDSSLGSINSCEDLAELFVFSGTNIATLAKALQIAVEALDYYKNHASVIENAYHSPDNKQITCVHTFINHKARSAIERINSLADGGNVAEK